MGHPSHHSFAHMFTPGWMPMTKSLAPHIEEPGKIFHPLLFIAYSLCHISISLLSKTCSPKMNS